MKIRLGTRASSLAVAQTEWVRDRLAEARPELEFEIIKIKTTGDRILDRPLADIGGKGLFVKEIERALIDEEIDCAVHSLKDMPVDGPDDLSLVCFPEREAPFDVLCHRADKPLAVTELPEGARVGTGSMRRQNQLLLARPDLEMVGLRGSIETRLGKRETLDLDAVVLAESGLRRAGIWESGFQRINPEICIPAPGQGTLAIQVRTADTETRGVLSTIHSDATHTLILAERACLDAIGGDCHTPFAAWAEARDDGIHLHARLFRDGEVAEEHAAASWDDGKEHEQARELGKTVGRALLDGLSSI